MKKFVGFLMSLSWLALLVYVGGIAYQNGFNVNTTLDTLITTYEGSVQYLLAFSTDLTYLLYLGAVGLYFIAVLLAFFKLFFQFRLFSAFSFLIHLSLTLIVLVSALIDPSLLSSVIDGLTTGGMVVLAVSASLLAFVGLSILSFLFLLLSFIRQPAKVKPTVNKPISVPVVEEDRLADELKRFVVPNQVSVQVPPVVKPLPQTQAVPMLQPQPIVQTPPLDTKRQLDELKARETVLGMKEKIRTIIRAQLAQNPPPTSQPEPTPTASKSGTSVIEPDQIKTMIHDLFQQELSRLLAQQKEELTMLINEELIKYDALNREVIDTMINEKIENQTVQALEHVEQKVQAGEPPSMQEATSSFVTKEELASALASLSQGEPQEEKIKAMIAPLIPSSNQFVTRDELQDMLAKFTIVPSPVSTLPEVDYVPETNEQPEATMALTAPVESVPLEEPVPQPLVETVTDSMPEPEPVVESEPSVAPEPEPLVSESVLAQEMPIKPQTKKGKKEKSVAQVLPLVTEIAPEDQFKSVLPPDSKVTRTGKKKIIRISFQDRMKTASLEQRQHYDELKNYLLSYRVKSRVSSVGDMFRLHKEEYVKIAIAGKGLKLYLALDPKDYADSTIPVDDASDKKMYQNIPLVFKVKSSLSVKRAKVLIDDLMTKKGLPQKEVLDLPWSKQFLD